MHVAGGNIYRAKQYEGHGSTSQVGKALNKLANRAARGGWVESSTRLLTSQHVVGG